MNKMKSCTILIIFLSVFGYNAKGEFFQQEASELQFERNDGPYIFYKENHVEIVTVQYLYNEQKIKIDSFPKQLLADKKIKVIPNAPIRPFSFNLFSYIPEPSFCKMPEKLIVVSDIEGNLEDFAKILQVTGVINKKYQWTYGSNHLLINGDLFDRGTDVTAFLWLCYKLDRESALAGGKVHIILGNHDEMNLRGNTNYVMPKYLHFSSALGIEHKKLYDENTEIGRWLRTKSSILIIDSTLFVHGGLSISMLALKLNPEQINNYVRENLGKVDTLMEPVPKFIFGSYGPFWYRGLVVNNPRYRPATPEQLNMILDYFGVKRIVVGHSIVPEIIGLHNGKVIAADVEHHKNRKEKKSRALLITNNQFFTINDAGKINKMPVVNGFGESIDEY